MEERARAGAPAYVYQVDWKSPKDGGIWGAPHTIDIGLVFGTLWVVDLAIFGRLRQVDPNQLARQALEQAVQQARRAGAVLGRQIGRAHV